jgi:hypothetical protein
LPTILQLQLAERVRRGFETLAVDNRVRGGEGKGTRKEEDRENDEKPPRGATSVA